MAVSWRNNSRLGTRRRPCSRTPLPRLPGHLGPLVRSYSGTPRAGASGAVVRAAGRRVAVVKRLPSRVGCAGPLPPPEGQPAHPHGGSTCQLRQFPMRCTLPAPNDPRPPAPPARRTRWKRCRAPAGRGCRRRPASSRLCTRLDRRGVVTRGKPLAGRWLGAIGPCGAPKALDGRIVVFRPAIPPLAPSRPAGHPGPRRPRDQLSLPLSGT